MSGPRGALVIGGSLAGLSAADALRAGGFTGAVTLIGDELHAPYDRPPLSKRLLDSQWKREDVTLRTSIELAADGIDFLPGRTASGLDVGMKVVQLADGSSLDYDLLMIATGASPRRILRDRLAGVHGVHVLRTLDHFEAIRSELSPESEVVIAGAGFLGTEVAAALARHVAAVTIVDPAQTPLQRAFGRDVGCLVADMHANRGVAIECGNSIVDVVAPERVLRSVLLQDGKVIPATLLLVAIGSEPNTSWLEGSGLLLSNGIDCDADGMVIPGVYAMGDVANMTVGGPNNRVRTEHRMSATEHGMTAARAALGLERIDRGPAYFWTDQYGIRFQAWGRWSDKSRRVIVNGSIEDGSFLIEYSDASKITGFLACDMAREFRAARGEVGRLLPQNISLS